MPPSSLRIKANIIVRCILTSGEGGLERAQRLLVNPESGYMLAFMTCVQKKIITQEVQNKMLDRLINDNYYDAIYFLLGAGMHIIDT